MAKQPYKGPRNFGEGMNSVFASAAHDAMLQTLRDLAMEPERQATVAQKTQLTQNAAEEQANKNLAAPGQRRLAEAKANYYGEQFQRMSDAASGIMDVKSMLTDKARLEKENASILDAGLKGAFRTPEQEAELTAKLENNKRLLQVYEHQLKLKQPAPDGKRKLTSLSEASAPAGSAPAPAPAKGKPAAAQKFASAQEVKAAFAAGSLDRAAALKILQEQFGYGD